MKLTNLEQVNGVINKEFSMIIAKSTTCGACQTIIPNLKSNVKNIDKIPLYEVYVDEFDQFRGEHLIFAVPTVLIFSKGKELLRESRYIDYSKITRLITMFSE